MHRLRSRKPWVCDGCGKEQAARSDAYVGRQGGWLESKETGLRVHVYGEVRLCGSCYHDGSPAKPKVAGTE